MASRRSTGAAAGWPGCSRPTAAGARSTPTTTPNGSTRSRSATSARLPTRPRADVTAHVVELLARGEGPRRSRSPRDRLPPGRAGGGRLLVRALGRQLRLRRRRCASGARGSRVLERPPGDPPGRRLARGAPERRRRLRRGLPLVRPRRGRRGLARARRVDAVADGLGAARAGRRRRGAARNALRGPSPGSAKTQKRNGGWDEAHFTGTGFPRDFLINYHLYREVWPVMALGRVRRALAE